MERAHGISNDQGPPNRSCLRARVAIGESGAGSRRRTRIAGSGSMRLRASPSTPFQPAAPSRSISTPQVMKVTQGNEESSLSAQAGSGCRTVPHPTGLMTTRLSVIGSTYTCSSRSRDAGATLSTPALSSCWSPGNPVNIQQLHLIYTQANSVIEATRFMALQTGAAGRKCDLAGLRPPDARAWEPAAERNK